MHRVLALIQLWFIKAIEYRTELVVWMSLTLFNTVIILSIWMSVFRDGSVVNGYHIGQIIQYFLLVTIINGVTASHFENWRSREVREGRIDYYLTKPIGYPLQVLCADIGNRLFYMTLVVPLCLTVYFAYSWWFQLPLLSLTFSSVTFFVLLLIVGYLIEYSFAFLAVLLTFWFEGAEGLEHFKWITITMFSGSMIPLELMPNWLRQTVEMLPLKYIYAVPIELIQQRRTLLLSDILYILFFLAGLWFVQYLLWHMAMRRYTSAG
jgi:ABC-2 type transport system permease protein